jgi:outer membrane scaffolding protein for murein synthesis (MipA/OmpV family)
LSAVAGCLFAGAVALACATASALALEAAPVEGSPAPSGGILTIGAFGDLEPRFEGARRHSFGLHGIIDYRSNGAREWLSLPNDGYDFALIETENFRAGPVVNGRWERDVSSLVRGFRRVGSINLSGEGGVFAEWWPLDSLRTRGEVRDAVIGARGLIADLSADLVWRPQERWTLTAGPRLSLADASFMRSYYSVDAQQSLASGLPVYTAPQGLRSTGAGSMVKYKWSETVSTMAFAEYQRFAGPAAESPLIETRGSPNQLTIGLGVSYNFAVGW